MVSDDTKRIIRHYHSLGFEYLKRKVFPSLTSRRRQFCFECVVIKSLHEIHNGCSGSEQLRKVLRIKHGFKVSRAITREVVHILDSEGVKRRARRRLRRRQYISKGPNYVWHADGYDKLTPYGICIHGCIDGFSRKILWLEANITNKRPEVIATYFINAVLIEGYPVKLRTDPGTENVIISRIQKELSPNEKAYVCGSSTSNQRIERWWGYLRQSRADFWIDHFKSLEALDVLDKSNAIHRFCLQYSYLPFIKKQLAEVVVVGIRIGFETKPRGI
ncbi:uncharacterized protein LOC127862645 isoform X2 [Dreissena polymorpha]|uniref:uncharacterized protein LOC127862645 isoform X2 n=1 Tax=Dreissena polymorpha TaxID=45954 RepID=UPI002263E390|nr:uncharacterized protein LOC127862645 isoform X2 [Dreissena polymorpha]